MDLAEFKAWALAQGTVAKYNDGQFKGQCVSLVNQYCYRVLKVPADAWGNAKDWATNQSVAKYFDKVSNILPGDLLVYPEAFGNGDGHIAIAVGSGMLDQNSDNDGKIKVHPIWNGYSAILRAKGENMYPNREQVVYIYKQTQGVAPTEEEIQHFLSIEWWPLITSLTGDNPGWVKRVGDSSGKAVEALAEIEQVITKYK
jgi:hypothetical protein